MHRIKVRSSKAIFNNCCFPSRLLHQWLSETQVRSRELSFLINAKLFMRLRWTFAPVALTQVWKDVSEVEGGWELMLGVSDGRRDWSVTDFRRIHIHWHFADDEMTEPTRTAQDPIGFLLVMLVNILRMNGTRYGHRTTTPDDPKSRSNLWLNSKTIIQQDKYLITVITIHKSYNAYESLAQDFTIEDETCFNFQDVRNIFIYLFCFFAAFA